MADCKKLVKRIPDTFQEVEYIQTNGNGEYIDTNYVPTANTKIKIDFVFLGSGYTASSSIPLLGERRSISSPGDAKFAFWINKDINRIAFTYGTYDSGYTASDIADVSIRNVTSNDLSNFYYNDSFVTGDDSATFSSTNLSIYLFAIHETDGMTYRYIRAKVYNMKIYENDTLVRNLIPCYRISDNVIGMYDTVNDVFYTNSGTGSFSKGNDVNTWIHSLRKLGTSTDTITTLPTELYADGTNATVSLKGNMSQTGTPTPDNPIQPSECGERTAQLFDKSTAQIGYRVSVNGVIPQNDTACSDFIYIHGLSHLYANDKSLATNFYFYKEDKTILSYTESLDTNVPSDAFYVRVNLNKSVIDTYILSSENLPYEPYGYKIPISSASTTTPVYLGEVETTRKIGKYVFKGAENWYDVSTNGVYYTNVAKDLANKNNYTPKCSHFKLIQQTTIANLTDGSFTSDGNVFFWFKESSITSLADWKAYLAQQYAAGTPVTVWYVLATETTGIVNEPIRKIGGYVDTVSGITIPTITGKDSFDVLTTLKPSEVELAYTGWHDAYVKEYVSDTPIADLESMSISQMENHTVQELQGGKWV